MPAWNHTSAWNDSAIERYRSFAARRAVGLYNKHEVIDCANFCLKILIEFASGKGLPVVIFGRTGSKNVETALASHLPEWSSTEAFMQAVLDGIEANEIIDGHGSAYKNTVTVAVSDMLPGDMLGHLSEAPIGGRKGTWGHMQLVTSTTLRSPYGRAIPTSGSAQIYQGNLSTGIFGSSPTTVQKGSYYFRSDQTGGVALNTAVGRMFVGRSKPSSPLLGEKFYYTREGQNEKDAAEMWRDQDITPVRWNFNQFNKLGLIYDKVTPPNVGYA
ncbi:hypothetical protein [Polyangium aurulentum]|uniref:hypothetical protein n=1 Tax=Polyangium aurulentum TaxID=2567896 RepID=UPI0010AEC9B8|nr:hypothetical protein [Polyangium aurulentum]UQA61365.1 hypothetical protein E8A73_013175 [Polyangium aurulentum]